MNLWPIINTATGALAAAFLAYVLFTRVNRFSLAERLGMAGWGAGMILTIAPILVQGPTPFEDWAGALIRVGSVVYLGGMISRHGYNNWLAKRQARRHFGR